MVRQERALIEARTGKPLTTDDWMAAFYERRNQRLRAELQAIDGALAAVRAAHAHAAGRIACASGADRLKVEFQIDMAGMRPSISATASSAATRCRAASPRPTSTFRGGCAPGRRPGALPDRGHADRRHRRRRRRGRGLGLLSAAGPPPRRLQAAGASWLFGHGRAGDWLASA